MGQDDALAQEHAILGSLYEGTVSPVQDTSSLPILQSYVVNPFPLIPLSGYDHKFENVSNENDYMLDTPGFVHSEFGVWPQRLLHVGSMTSFEWRPGNIYGGFIEPKYNAISYTWGRYDIDSPYIEKKPTKSVKRNARAIKIHGTAWSIPRVHPEQFDTSDFQGLIERSPELGMKCDTKFLWLDVACIDQRNGPQNFEIGRQAKIFRGAQKVFIWLTRLEENPLEEILNTLTQSSSEYYVIGRRS